MCNFIIRKSFSLASESTWHLTVFGRRRGRRGRRRRLITASWLICRSPPPSSCLSESGHRYRTVYKLFSWCSLHFPISSVKNYLFYVVREVSPQRSACLESHHLGLMSWFAVFVRAAKRVESDVTIARGTGHLFYCLCSYKQQLSFKYSLIITNKKIVTPHKTYIIFLFIKKQCLASYNLRRNAENLNISKGFFYLTWYKLDNNTKFCLK